jgi:hypothetical protein
MSIQKYKTYILGLILGLVTLVIPAFAAAQAVTQGYNADNSIQQGMLVKLKDKDKTSVEAVNDATLSKLQGVVVAANDAPVTLSTTSTQQQVFVATSGRYSVLVSNQNGTIQPGDNITISALAGIGMKAGTIQSLIAGKAIQGFDGKKNVNGTAKLKSNGQTVAIGTIQMDISIARNPIAVNHDVHVAGWLQNIGETVGSKPVNPIRLYGALIVLVISIITAGSMMYSGVHTSLVAIGRNPLAKKSILKSLLVVVLVSLVVVVVGLGAVYLLLKL